MFLQMTTLVEWLVTFGVRKWLLSCEDPSKCHQITNLLECIVTFCASKWLLSCVDPFMCLQIPTLVECLITFGAGKCLLYGGDPFMFLQMTTLVEWLVTFGAGKCFLSCVDPSICHQSAWMHCDIWSRQMSSLTLGGAQRPCWSLQYMQKKKKTECLCAAAVMLCTKGFFV